MFFKALAFLTGMMSLYWLTEPIGAQYAIGFASFYLLMDFWFRKRLSLVGFLNLGIIWASLHLLFWYHHTNQIIADSKVAQVEGYICSIPQISATTTRFNFCLTNIDQEPLAFWQSNKIRVTWGQYAIPAEPSVKAGQFWQLQVKLKPVYGKVNPYAFDFEKWMVSEKIIGSASVRNQSSLQNVDDIRASYHQFRQSIYDHFIDLIPAVPSRGLMLALLMGERGRLSDENWQVFQASGTSHLLAISGLHIGIAALWSYWVVSLLWRFSARLCQLIAAPLAAEVASLIGAVLLLALSGFGLPAIRAVIMLALFLNCRWFSIHLRLINVLGLALLIILVLQPFAILSMSFWLSFSAVLVIAMVLDKSLAQGKHWHSWLKINAYLYLAMMPISWWFFAQFSWVALLANLLLIPLMTFVLMPLLYVVAMLSLWTSSIAKFSFWILTIIFSYSYEIQEYFASWNRSFEISLYSNKFVPIAFMLLALLLLPRKLPFKWLALPLLAILSLSYFVSGDEAPELEIWLFDIGHGLAVYMQTPDNNLVYDTGWGNRNYASLNSSVLPFLKQRKILQLDKVVISHDDADHSGGLNQLKNAVDVQEVISGEKLSSSKSVSCHDYPGWNWQGIDFRFVNHDTAIYRHGNNSSCVLAIKTKNYSLLLTGDIEKTVENQLVMDGIANFDILVAPHHGSKTSSTPTFVEKVNPSHVIFSTGFNNQWHFPKSEILERYKGLGSQIWITHRDGAIYIRLDDEEGLEINGLRHLQAYFWRQSAHLHEEK